MGRSVIFQSWTALELAPPLEFTSPPALAKVCPSGLNATERTLFLTVAWPARLT